MLRSKLRLELRASKRSQWQQIWMMGFEKSGNVFIAAPAGTRSSRWIRWVWAGEDDCLYSLRQTYTNYDNFHWPRSLSYSLKHHIRHRRTSLHAAYRCSTFLTQTIRNRPLYFKNEYSSALLVFLFEALSKHQSIWALSGTHQFKTPGGRTFFPPLTV